MFGGFFDDFLNLGAGRQQTGPPPPSQPSGPPPASQKAMAALPSVTVTADDLLEETNKECVICLVEQMLGSTACKLPCGHLFHRKCVCEWLSKKCMCPVCRYELETDDPSYEAQRKSRMKTRKLRMRLDELQGKTIAQLRTISRDFGVSISHCIDKSEIVQALVRSGCIDITERVPPIEISSEDFYAKSVGQLKQLMLSFGLSAEGLLEKREIQAALLSSGRVLLLPSAPSSAQSAEEHKVVNEEKQQPPRKEENDREAVHSHADAAPPQPQGTSQADNQQDDISSQFVFVEREEAVEYSEQSPSPSPSASSPVSSNAHTEEQLPPSPTQDGRVAYSRSQLRAMSLGALKLLCNGLGVSLHGCLDRDEILDRLRLCNKFRLLEEE